LERNERLGNAWFSSAFKRKFISFEGPEGAGKSTQVKRLSARMGELGLRVVVTREPGGTQIGERVRDILLSFSQDQPRPVTEALLMTAARAQHVDEVIVPALASGSWLITDRYVDSTYAYQGFGRGLDLELLRDSQQLATRGILPGTTFLLDLPVELGLSRRLGSSEAFNRLDVESRDFHERVRTGYGMLRMSDPERWVVIDASQDEDVVAADIWSAMKIRFADELSATPNHVSGTSE
jgi:dTMP kinase